MPVNYGRLCDNCRHNGLENVITPLNIPLGANDHEHVFIEIEGHDHNRTGTANILPGTALGRLEIVCRTLDGLIAEGTVPSDISLIKIDTDGYDFNVLKGARRLLEAQRPVVFTEMSAYCLRWHGQTIEQVLAFLAELGYEMWPKRASGFTFTDKVDPASFGQDALLVPSESRATYSRFLTYLNRVGSDLPAA